MSTGNGDPPAGTRLRARLERLERAIEALDQGPLQATVAKQLASQRIEGVLDDLESLASDQYNTNSETETSALQDLLYSQVSLTAVDSLVRLSDERARRQRGSQEWFRREISAARRGVKVRQIVAAEDWLSFAAAAAPFGAAMALVDSGAEVRVVGASRIREEVGGDFTVHKDANAQTYGTAAGECSFSITPGSVRLMVGRDSARRLRGRFDDLWNLPDAMPLTSLKLEPGAATPGARDSVVPTKLSVRDLFGDFVVLRDLEPRFGTLRGLNAVRNDLGIPDGVTPRKNEPDYARVVVTLLNQLAGTARGATLYVGDTVLSDGNVVRNLAELCSEPVLGFICNPREFGPSGEFALGSLIFSDSWERLWKLPAAMLASGCALGSIAAGLFDLDHTVYAAKGRDAAPLRLARVEAVRNLLLEALGEARLDLNRMEYMYSRFDHDDYHPYTGDNQDYVVFLTLVACLGLLSPEEMSNRLFQGGMTLGSLIEEVRTTIQRRRSVEDLGAVWEIVQEIYYNTRSGDQTPFKRFRLEEYLCTRRRMVTDTPDGRITLTREVADLIHFLRARNVPVLAVSDRPVIATEGTEDAGKGSGSLLDIPLELSGSHISPQLDTIALKSPRLDG